MNPLFLLGAAALIMAGVGAKNTFALTKALATRMPGKAGISKAMHAIILATQLYELVLVIKHVSPATVAGALLLLAMLAAVGAGTKDNTV